MSSALFEIIFYFTSYPFAYLITYLIEVFVQKFYPKTFEQLDSYFWLQLYMFFTVIMIHFSWILCRKYRFYHCDKNRGYIYPILISLPMYIYFCYQYIDYYYEQHREGKIIGNRFNDRMNRILNHVIILFFVLNIIFLFLEKKTQQKILQYVNFLFLLEFL